MLQFCEYLIKYQFNLVTGIRYRAHFSLCQEKNTHVFVKRRELRGERQVGFQGRGFGNSVLLPSLCQKVKIDKASVSIFFKPPLQPRTAKEEIGENGSFFFILGVFVG